VPVKATKGLLELVGITTDPMYYPGIRLFVDCWIYVVLVTEALLYVTKVLYCYKNMAPRIILLDSG